MALYATLEHNNEIKEHFIGIYPINKVVKSLEQYFLDHSIDMPNARFACMGTEMGLNPSANMQHLT